MEFDGNYDRVVADTIPSNWLESTLGIVQFGMEACQTYECLILAASDKTRVEIESPH